MSKQDSVGVIVARFQVPDITPELTPGHCHLIKTVRDRHEHVLFVLGVHGGERTDHDPLTFEERADMVRERYPDRTTIVKLRDHPYSTDRWSKWLNKVIEDEVGRDVMLYDSRMGFTDVYSGGFPHTRIENVPSPTGSEIRRGIKYSSQMTAREALIRAQVMRSPIPYSTNDVAVLDEIHQRVLLGTKDWLDGKWSLLGGFLDPQLDTNDFRAAARERSEEVTGIETGALTPLGDRFRVDDPRYRQGKDKIFSRLFACTYRGGDPVGADDIKTVRWFDRQELRDVIAPWHMPHVDQLEAYWSGRQAA